MPTLHLMVGLPCSGKTTLARQLEQEYSALRLTTDEWHTRLFGQDATDERHDARHELIESLLWDIASRALSIGVDVILDFGCWVRCQRDDFRARAKGLGADFKIHFTDAPEKVLLERLAERNTRMPPGVFQIRESSLREWFLIFEPPSKEELDTDEASVQRPRDEEG
jgi:predicted kinase